MFSAFFGGQLVGMVGQPLDRETQTTIGTLYPDRATAVAACENHFSSTVKHVLHEAAPENDLIADATLVWQGNHAEPDRPLGVHPLPNGSVYRASYSIIEAM